MNRIKKLLKALAAWVFTRYELQRVYRIDLREINTVPTPAPSPYVLRRITQSDVQHCPVPRIRDRAGYGGDNSYGFAVLDANVIVCMTWVWDNKRFRPDHLCQPADREAVLVDLVTLDSHRGRGLAPLLTRFAVSQLKSDGFETVYAWVWHSNTPSIRSFEKAGWDYIAFVVYFELRGLRPISFRYRRSKPGSGPSHVTAENRSGIEVDGR